MLSRLRAGSVVLTCALLAAVQFQPASAATAAATALPATAAPAGGVATAHTNPATAPASLASVSAMPDQTGQQLAVPVAPGLQPARITGSIAVTALAFWLPAAAAALILAAGTGVLLRRRHRRAARAYADAREQAAADTAHGQ